MQRSPEDIARSFAANHFSRFLGLELVSVTEDGVTICLPVQEHHLQNAGFVHGGVLATMADVAMGFAAVTHTPKGNLVLTGDLRISYLNPGLGPHIYARGYSIKTGRKIVFTEAEIYREENGKRIEVCKASATMVVVEKM
jgi:uncharacterized protein (TIGR00369 family)